MITKWLIGIKLLRFIISRILSDAVDSAVLTMMYTVSACQSLLFFSISVKVNARQHEYVLWYARTSSSEVLENIIPTDWIKKLLNLYSSQNTKTEMMIWWSRCIREGTEIDREFWSENLEGRDPCLLEGWQVFTGPYWANVVGTEQPYVTQDRITWRPRVNKEIKIRFDKRRKMPSLPGRLSFP